MLCFGGQQNFGLPYAIQPTVMPKHKSCTSHHSRYAVTTQWILWSSVVAIYLFTTVGALDCFQCVSTSASGGDCLLNNEGLINASLKLDTKDGKEQSPYRKNCTGSNVEFTRCFIEQHVGPGDENVFYHRGCHDGVTFNSKVSSARFDNLSANNQTTCAKPPLLPYTAVCFTFCDTDMCNGPQPVVRIDYCQNYNASDPNANLPEDVFCGVNSLHSNVYFSVLIAVVVTAISIYPTVFIESH